MRNPPINDVLAENLRHFMEKRGLTQQALASKCGDVGQTTIGLYLHPARRKPSAKGKRPSTKLSEIESIAKALDVAVWELLRAFTPDEREAYRQIEEAFRLLRGRPMGNGTSPLLLAA